MQPVEDKCRDHNQRHDTDRAIPMQAESQRDTRENKIVSVPGAQATDEEEKRGGDEEQVQWKAKSHPADDVRPIADARQDESEQSNTASTDLLAKQIDERQSQKAENGCTQFETEE